MRNLKHAIIFSLVIHILVLGGIYAYTEYLLYKLGANTLYISFDGFFSDNITIEILCWLPITFVLLMVLFMAFKYLWTLWRGQERRN
jgi:hypothetical protein